MNDENFCSLPFTEIFLGPDGHIKTCCSASDSIGSLHKNPIEEILQSETAKEIRQYIIDGRWHKNCSQCQRQEQQNSRSERYNNYIEFKSKHKKINRNTFSLERLDLRWSNTCNLSCVYCYEYFSSKWAEIKGIKVNTIKEENENTLFLLIEKHKENIQSILMLGGEPFLQKQNHRLLDILPDHGFYVVSNLAIPLRKNKIAEKILNAPSSVIGVSFETVDKRFEYVRRGANWNTFCDNIAYIKSNFPHKKLESHSLYSIYSAFNLVEFYDFIVEHNFNNVFWNVLNSSGYNASSNPALLPKNIRDRAVEEINAVLEKYPGMHGTEELLKIKNSMSDQKKFFQKNNSKIFLEEISILEKKLVDDNLKFADIWPDLYRKLSQ
jgi:organic radical activating enzyme